MSHRVIQLFSATAFAISLLLPAVKATAIEVSATIDRNPIYSDESVNLVLQVEGESTNGLSPDLEPLRVDFEILTRSSQTNINIVNNKPQVVQSWVIEIQPRRLGVLEIPSISLGSVQTEPIQLEVQEFKGNVATEGAQIFLEVEVSSNNPYVQAQVNFTSRLFYSIPIVTGTLSEPQVSFATVKGPAQDKRYNAKRAGIEYRVIERRYAIFPEQSGSFSIAPIQFNCVVERTDPATNVKNHYRERYSSNPVQLDVRAIPRSYSGSTWLPAQDLTLSDSWHGRAPDFEAGKPESREISIDAVGLRAVQLPMVDFEQNSTARIYGGTNADLKTTPTFDWSLARRTDEFAIIPQNDSIVEVPKFEIIWWDVNEDREKVAVLPAISVQIGQRADQQMASDHSDNGSESADFGNLNPVKDIANEDRQWKLISLTLLAIWLLTLASWYLSRRSKQRSNADGANPHTRQIESEQKAIRKIRQACASSDAAAVNVALLQWAALHWENRPPRNLAEVAQRLNSKQLTDQFENLDKANYSHHQVSCDCHAVWRSFSEAITHERRQTNNQKRFKWFMSRETKLEELWPESETSTS